MILATTHDLVCWTERARRRGTAQRSVRFELIAQKCHQDLWRRERIRGGDLVAFLLSRSPIGFVRVWTVIPLCCPSAVTLSRRTSVEFVCRANERTKSDDKRPEKRHALSSYSHTYLNVATWNTKHSGEGARKGCGKRARGEAAKRVNANRKWRKEKVK